MRMLSIVALSLALAGCNPDGSVKWFPSNPDCRGREDICLRALQTMQGQQQIWNDQWNRTQDRQIEIFRSGITPPKPVLHCTSDGFGNTTCQ